MNTTRELPPFMAEGSEGPHVGILHAFLTGARLGQGLEFDNKFGPMTTSKIKTLQEDNRLDPDGCFGPETRNFVKIEYGFDFDALCKMIPGKTVFCDTAHGQEPVTFEK